MTQKTDTLEALHADLKDCLARYIARPDEVLAEIWPYVTEAVDFNQFVEQSATGQGATFSDPYPELTPEEIEAQIEERQSATGEVDSLAQSQGKWAKDGI